MKLFKNTICLITLLALGLFLFPLGGTVDASTHKLGTVIWTIEDGRATISGTGKMADGGCPWTVNKEEITEVIIESGVTEIGEQVFKGFTNLTTVTIKNGLYAIGKSAFIDCKKLTSITLPASLKTVESGAFYGCTALKSVHISDVAAWCNVDFEYDSANPLQNGAYLYLKGQQVVDLVIPEGVKEVKKYTFWGCLGLESVYFPDGLEKIGRNSFANCGSLKQINVPGSLQHIGSSAFGDCNQLKLAIFRGRLAKLRKVQYDHYNSEFMQQLRWQQSTGYAMLTSLATGLVSVGMQGGIVFLALHIRRKRRGY